MLVPHGSAVAATPSLIQVNSGRTNGGRMERFIARSNIARFEQMLTRETDPEERRIVETLLAEERVKLLAAEASCAVPLPRPRVADSLHLPG
jgi:hypothetical protein